MSGSPNFLERKNQKPDLHQGASDLSGETISRIVPAQEFQTCCWKSGPWGMECPGNAWKFMIELAFNSAGFWLRF